MAGSMTEVVPETSGQRFEVVLLAGALWPSPLRKAMDVPVLCLPVSADAVLMDLWLDVTVQHAGCLGMRVVVSSSTDRARVQDSIDQYCERRGDVNLPPIEVQVDPHEYRGPAGRLRDIAESVQLADDAVLVVGEASSVPPQSLHELLAEDEGDDTVGRIGISADNEPAGVYTFKSAALDIIPQIGFYDLKEQWLPALYERGMRVKTVRVVENLSRIRDRCSYLEAVRQLQGRWSNNGASHDQMASVHATFVCSKSLISSGVTVEEGAIIHGSIVMRGAVIGNGAVVSNSIVGPRETVSAKEVIRSSVIASASFKDASNRRSRGGLRRAVAKVTTVRGS